MYYPIKVWPIFKDYIWGGRNLEKYKRKFPEGIIAESWELSCLDGNNSIIANGEFCGRVLNELIYNNPEAYLGKNYNGKGEKFPLLFKLIDAQDDLSIQVHPDDRYAYNNENETYGKTEMWYVLEAKPDSKLILGFNENIRKDEIVKAIKENKQKGLYNEVSVKKGDIIYIPSGTVHAINSGVIIAEIQQNSNLTYRIYDYDRVRNGVKRELHIDKALDVIKYDNKSIVHRGIVFRKNNILVKMLTDCEYFTIKEFSAFDDSVDIDTEDCFNVLMIIEGKCKIVYKNGEIDLSAVETVFIPAKLGIYELRGSFKLLHISLPKNRKSLNNLYKSLGFIISKN